jgi:hypothetical protein
MSDTTALTKGQPEQSRSLAEAAGEAVFRDYGSPLGWRQINALLLDRRHVRFPCEIKFDASLLLPGECAHTFPRSSSPEQGYVIYVHPQFEAQLSSVPCLALHQIWFVNQGLEGSLDDAELFGSRALGIPLEVYYATLCDLAAALGGDDLC